MISFDDQQMTNAQHTIIDVMVALCVDLCAAALSIGNTCRVPMS